MDKIICVGKNYLKHAKEMGDPVPGKPILFLKPASCIFRLGESDTLKLPRHLGEIHHELELVFKIRKGDNGDYSFCGWTVGIDLTAREMQTELKEKGHPWERAKAFPQSAITGEILGLPADLENLDTPFELYVNDQLRQRGVGSEMRWKPDDLLIEVAHAFALCDGDLLFTGTPEGVGPIKPGDHLLLRLGNMLEHHLRIE